MNSLDQAAQIRQYMVITGNYWAFTLTDGALRMLVVLYFYQLGFSPLNIALLFLFYEFFGVVTNLLGGWLGALIGLNKTMNIGLFLQVIALSLLLVPAEWLTVLWVMCAQALSGIAKDLNKMSAKSAIKLLVPANEGGRLFKWVAFLTGSKNTLKGAGYFLGALLLSLFGFEGAIAGMAGTLALVWLASLVLLKTDLGRAKTKPKFSELFSKSTSINYLSAARLFLFASRDVWFVVALPVFLVSELQWSTTFVGAFLASWIIAYGVVQALTPRFLLQSEHRLPDGRTAFQWAVALAAAPIIIAAGLFLQWPLTALVIGGLMMFGVIFAINSSLHSYLIVEYASADNVSLDVGFYYMANAMGRLLGTVLSGWLFQQYGLGVCLIVSGVMVMFAAGLALAIPTPAMKTQN